MAQQYVLLEKKNYLWDNYFTPQIQPQIIECGPSFSQGSSSTSFRFRRSVKKTEMMSVVTTPFVVPSAIQSLSSSETFSVQHQVHFLTEKFSGVCLRTSCSPFRRLTIRMGGGPRTYPGGVSKWQWKRMQKKKSQQLLKARLARERQIYEMRKRAELKAAVSELERPWEVVEKAPTLFSVSADEQLKVLADRFQKPGGFDMWSDRDGPELFKPNEELPSARFFPKGVVHSIRPYESVGSHEGEISGSGVQQDHLLDENHDRVPERIINARENVNSVVEEDSLNSSNGGSVGVKRNIRKKKYKKGHTRGLDDVELRNNSEKKNDSKDPVMGSTKLNATRKAKHSSLAVYDLNLQEDGSYGFRAENRQ